jgi:hypothetical protein
MPRLVVTTPNLHRFQKELFHNGYAKSLKQLVHFYNTRDVFAFPVTSGNCPAGTIEKVTCWPMPEVPNNIDMTVGNLGLTDQKENLIVIFLQTLTDGFTRPYPDINTFTGRCKKRDGWSRGSVKAARIRDDLFYTLTLISHQGRGIKLVFNRFGRKSLTLTPPVY